MWWTAENTRANVLNTDQSQKSNSQERLTPLRKTGSLQLSAGCEDCLAYSGTRGDVCSALQPFKELVLIMDGISREQKPDVVPLLPNTDGNHQTLQWELNIPIARITRQCLFSLKSMKIHIFHSEFSECFYH